MVQIHGVWQEELDSEFEIVAPFLRPTSRIADSYPCPDPGENCPRRIVDHGNGEIVAVCRDGGRCDRLSLTRESIVIWEVDLAKFCREVGRTLGFETAPRPEMVTRGAWRIGTHSIGTGNHILVYLGLPSSSENFRRIVTELVISVSGPFVLLTPLSHRAASSTLEILRKSGAYCGVLDELLMAGERAGELAAKGSLADLIRSATESVKPSGNIFRRSGNTWTIAFQGKSTQLTDTKGLRCLQVLLQNPKREYPPACLEPAAGLIPPPPPTAHTHDDDLHKPADGYKVIDNRAEAEIRNKLKEIESDLAEADANNDIGKAERLRSEKRQLEQYLLGAIGLHGEPRRLQDPGKQARDRVTQAVLRSRRAIGRELPLLGEHLDAALKLGTLWSYRPQQPMDWRF